MFTKANIPQVERKHYSKSFLYSIAVMLTYDRGDVLDDKSNDIIKYLHGCQWNLNKKDSTGIVLIKNDIAILLHSRAIILSIPKSSYSGFESLLTVFHEIEEVLRMADAQNVTNIYINKTNRYLIKKELVKSREWVMSQLFSKPFIKAYDESTGVMAISGEILTLFNIEEKEKDDIKVYDFSISVSKMDNKGLGILSQVVYELNNRMFSAWSWAVSDNVKSMMEEQNNDKK